MNEDANGRIHPGRLAARSRPDKRWRAHVHGTQNVIRSQKPLTPSMKVDERGE